MPPVQGTERRDTQADTKVVFFSFETHGLIKFDTVNSPDVSLNDPMRAMMLRGARPRNQQQLDASAELDGLVLLVLKVFRKRDRKFTRGVQWHVLRQSPVCSDGQRLGRSSRCGAVRGRAQGGLTKVL